MDQKQQEEKEYLDHQLQWTVEQISILDEMNLKLHEMKSIAEYSLEHILSATEIEKLNGELDKLKIEFNYLERQLYPIYH